MILSPFTPLQFGTHRTDGLKSEYIQTFASTDRILIQVLVYRGERVNTDLHVYTEPGHVFFATLPMMQWEINDDVTLHFIELNLSNGYYTIEIEGIGKSAVFRVTDDTELLENTTLIQYSMKDNRQRTDVVFFIDRMQRFFDFRVPGGFKDSGWSFSVESEQFTTQNADIVQLYGLESTQKRFTMGGGLGVPVWFGEMLNRLLVCTHVYFDGVKYTRKDSSVPEMTEQLEGKNSFVFNQTLQRSVNLDPVIEGVNHTLIMRGADTGFRCEENYNNRIIY